MENIDWSQVKISVGNVSNLTGENIFYQVEIFTEQGNHYKTGVLDEHDFQCMGHQKYGDKIKELKVMRSSVNSFLLSEKISDGVKEQLKKILK